jgi:hypothetical protein
VGSWLGPEGSGDPRLAHAEARRRLGKVMRPVSAEQHERSALARLPRAGAAGGRLLDTDRLAPAAAAPRRSGQRPRNDLVSTNGLVDPSPGTDDQAGLFVGHSVLEIVLAAGHPGDQEWARLCHGARGGVCAPYAVIRYGVPDRDPCGARGGPDVVDHPAEGARSRCRRHGSHETWVRPPDTERKRRKPAAEMWQSCSLAAEMRGDLATVTRRSRASGR